MARTAATFKQSDLERAMKAARRAALGVARTEIRPDGTIVLFHQSDTTSAAPVDEFDAWRAKKNARSS